MSPGETDVMLRSAGGIEASNLTFFDHPNDKAFLEATVLAPVPPAFVHRAAFGSQTHVLGIFLDCALKKEQNVES